MSVFSQSTTAERRDGAEPAVFVPAFQNFSHVLLFVALVLACLVSPFLMDVFGPIKRAKIYKSIPLRLDNYYTVGRLLAVDEPVDIVFLGGSETFTAIDAPLIAKVLSSQLGRKIVAYNLSGNWKGHDRAAQVLKDILTKKRPKLILLGETPHTYGQPHFLSKYFWDGTVPLDSSSLSQKLNFYLMRVLGAPRQIWIGAFSPTLRSRIPWDKSKAKKLVDAKGFRFFQEGWTGNSKYRPAGPRGKLLPPMPLPLDRTVARQLDVGQMIWDGRQPTTEFRHGNKEYACLQTDMMQFMKNLSDNSGATFVSLQVPIEFEKAVLGTVVVRPLCGFEPRSWPTLSVPMRDLFGPDIEKAKLYYNNPRHLNPAGAEVFTTALMPALKELLLAAERR